MKVYGNRVLLVAKMQDHWSDTSNGKLLRGEIIDVGTNITDLKEGDIVYFNPNGTGTYYTYKNVTSMNRGDVEYIVTVPEDIHLIETL